MMDTVLRGIRVLEWSMAGAAPEAGRILGGLGADVIKIEERLSGDGFRWVEKLGGLVPIKGPRFSLLFETLNYNKRSITLDLKKPEGKQIMERLVAESDVFLTNFRETASDRLGLDYQTLSTINPRLIYARSSGYGRKGDERNSPAYDFAVMGRAGLMLNQRSPDAEGGPFSTWGLGDETTGTLLAFAIVSALLARERTGKGQEVHCSLLGSLMWLQAMNFGVTLLTGKDFPAHDRANAGNALMNSYRGSDGKWLILSMGSLVERFWPHFCPAIGRPDLMDDPRFATLGAREENRRELIRLLDEVFAQKPRDEWIEILVEADCAVAPVNRLTDLVNDPQAVANDYIVNYDHPTLGQVKATGEPFYFSETPFGIARPAPELGEHTEEVLLEFGYSWDELAKFRDAEVV